MLDQRIVYPYHGLWMSEGLLWSEQVGSVEGLVLSSAPVVAWYTYVVIDRIALRRQRALKEASQEWIERVHSLEDSKRD